MTIDPILAAYIALIIISVIMVFVYFIAGKTPPKGVL